MSASPSAAGEAAAVAASAGPRPQVAHACYGSSALRFDRFVLGATHSRIILPPQETERLFANVRADVFVDMANRRMLVRAADGRSHLYRVGVGRPEAHIPLGRTRITHKRYEPSWWPTPNARRRDPTLPAVIDPSADNPLGSRALNLAWKYYLIHGTNDARKIGRGATWGCVSLYEAEAQEVYDALGSGTRVRFEPDTALEVAPVDVVDPVYAVRGLPPKVSPLPNGSPSEGEWGASFSQAVRPERGGAAQNAAGLALAKSAAGRYERLREAKALLSRAVWAGSDAALVNLAHLEFRLSNLTNARRLADAAVAAGNLEATPLAAYLAIEGLGGPRDLLRAERLSRLGEAAGVPGARAVRELDMTYLFSKPHWIALQEALIAHGYDAGRTDGLFKDRSQRALAAYAAALGEPANISLRTLSGLGLLPVLQSTIRQQRYIRRY